MIRRLVAALSSRSAGDTLDLAHLALYFESSALGPVQRDEALLLFALVRVARPRVIVEFGFHRGHSSLNFLCAMPSDSRLVSFDTADSARALAEAHFAGDPRFRFVHKSQDALAGGDLDGDFVDLVFFDGAHDLLINQRAFAAVLPFLTPQAIVAVHDTGAWSRGAMTPRHREWAATRPGGWLPGGDFAPWPEERAFVNWLRVHHSDFAQVHLHAQRTLRHGLTVLQRSRSLAEDYGA